MAKFLSAIGAFLRDVRTQYISGTLCLLWRRHRGAVPVGFFEQKPRKGFRTVKVEMLQCTKCLAFTMSPGDARRIGGK